MSDMGVNPDYKPQTQEEALNAIRDAVKESNKHPSQQSGKKYLVLRRDKSGNEYVKVDTVSWGEWFLAKLGLGGGAKLEKIAEFFEKKKWRNEEYNRAMKPLAYKYLKKM